MRRGTLAFACAFACAMIARAPASPPPDVNEHVLVHVPAGVHRVGAPGHALNPAREVTLAAFEVADCETTTAQFARFVEATGYVTTAERRGSGLCFRPPLPDFEWADVPGASWRHPQGPSEHAAAPDHPVTQVSALDADAYCAWLGVRLPTSDEWEVAARAGVSTRRPWGDDARPPGDPRANVADDPDDGFALTAPVRSFPPNAWGLHDVIGNVFEYTADRRPGAQGQTFVVARGGSWWCAERRCAYHDLVELGVQRVGNTLSNQGFRVAR